MKVRVPLVVALCLAVIICLAFAQEPKAPEPEYAGYVSISAGVLVEPANEAAVKAAIVAIRRELERQGASIYTFGITDPKRSERLPANPTKEMLESRELMRLGMSLRNNITITEAVPLYRTVCQMLLKAPVKRVEYASMTLREFGPPK